MDTLSHALIGYAVAGFSGHTPAINDPVYIATLLGAQAPDFDIIAQFRGKMAYLRQHRTFSHSFPGLLLWSSLISGILQPFFPSEVAMLFLWSFAGGLSHIVFDYLNTHGAALLWPIKKERKSCYLLNVFDPFIILLISLAEFLPLLTLQKSLISFSTIALYVGLRVFLRCRAALLLKKEILQHPAKITLMPSLRRLLHWDFVIQKEDCYLLGQIGLISNKIEFKTQLPKQEYSSFTLEAQKTQLGEFFTTFTPYAYFSEKFSPDSIMVNIYDLRYFVDQDFVHSATIVFGDNNVPRESYIRSYGQIFKFNA